MESSLNQKVIVVPEGNATYRAPQEEERCFIPGQHVTIIKDSQSDVAVAMASESDELDQHARSLIHQRMGQRQDTMRAVIYSASPLSRTLMKLQLVHRKWKVTEVSSMDDLIKTMFSFHSAPREHRVGVVIVDCITHEPAGEIVSQIRVQQQCTASVHVNVIFLSSPRQPGGRGFHLEPREPRLTVRDAYACGFDLVVTTVFDNSVAEDLTELFMSASARWSRASAPAAPSSNFLQIRTLLSDVTDRFSANSEDIPEGHSSNPHTHAHAPPLETLDQHLAGPDCIDTHPDYVVLLGRYQFVLQELEELKNRMAQAQETLVARDTTVATLEKEVFRLRNETVSLNRALENPAHTEGARERLELMHKHIQDDKRVKLLESTIAHLRRKLDAAGRDAEERLTLIREWDTKYSLLQRELHETKRALEKERRVSDGLQKKLSDARRKKHSTLMSATSESNIRDLVELQDKKRVLDVALRKVFALENLAGRQEQSIMTLHDRDGSVGLLRNSIANAAACEALSDEQSQHVEATSGARTGAAGAAQSRRRSSTSTPRRDMERTDRGGSGIISLSAVHSQVGGEVKTRRKSRPHPSMVVTGAAEDQRIPLASVPAPSVAIREEQGRQSPERASVTDHQSEQLSGWCSEANTSPDVMSTSARIVPLAAPRPPRMRSPSSTRGARWGSPRGVARHPQRANNSTKQRSPVTRQQVTRSRRGTGTRQSGPSLSHAAFEVEGRLKSLSGLIVAQLRSIRSAATADAERRQDAVDTISAAAARLRTWQRIEFTRSRQECLQEQLHSDETAMKTLLAQVLDGCKAEREDPSSAAARRLAPQYAVLHLRHARISAEIQDINDAFSAEGQRRKAALEQQLASSLQRVERQQEVHLAAGDLPSFAEEYCAVLKILEELQRWPDAQIPERLAEAFEGTGMLAQGNPAQVAMGELLSAVALMPSLHRDDDRCPSGSDAQGKELTRASLPVSALESLVDSAEASLTKTAAATTSAVVRYIEQQLKIAQEINEEVRRSGTDVRLFNHEVDLAFLSQFLSPDGHVEVTPGVVLELYVAHHKQVLRLLKELKIRSPLSNVNIVDAVFREREMLAGECGITRLQKANVPLQMAADTALIARFADFFTAETAAQRRMARARYRQVICEFTEDRGVQTDGAYGVSLQSAVGVRAEQRPHSRTADVPAAVPPPSSATSARRTNFASSVLVGCETPQHVEFPALPRAPAHNGSGGTKGAIFAVAPRLSAQVAAQRVVPLLV